MKKIVMSMEDKKAVIDRYSTRYKEYGYSPKTLGWDKGKQDIRYSMLFKEFTLNGKSILDIGCGFGDANKVLEQQKIHYTYLGIDIVDDLINVANGIYENDENINFILEDFLDKEFEYKYDIVVASGVFNFKLMAGDNYQFIELFMKKAFNLANDGIAFDFLSDKVEYQYKHTFHSNPVKILDVAYNLSKRVVLNNNYMPFEFCITIFKDDSFNPNNTIFTKFQYEK